MEEYITRTEFEQFKRQMEQKTEEMKAIRVDVHNVDVEAIKQELKTVSNTWLDTLQEHYTEHKQDITDVQTVQKGHSKFFEEHGKRLAAMATKEELRNELSAMESRINKNIDVMKDSLLDAIKQLQQQKPSGDQEQP
jgi:DNA repair exonuclease SbcCD ATPase subunit